MIELLVQENRLAPSQLGKRSAPIAQWIEHQFPVLKVGSSNLPRGTIRIGETGGSNPPRIDGFREKTFQNNTNFSK